MGKVRFRYLLAFSILVFIPFLNVDLSTAAQQENPAGMALQQQGQLAINVSFMQGLAPDFSNLLVRFNSSNGSYEDINHTLIEAAPSEWAMVMLPRTPNADENIIVLALNATSGGNATTPAGAGATAPSEGNAAAPADSGATAPSGSNAIEPAPRYQVISSGEDASVINTSRGNTLTISRDALDALEKNKTVRVFVKSKRRIDPAAVQRANELLRAAAASGTPTPSLVEQTPGNNPTSLNLSAPAKSLIFNFAASGSFSRKSPISFSGRAIWFKGAMGELLPFLDISSSLDGASDGTNGTNETALPTEPTPALNESNGTNSTANETTPALNGTNGTTNGAIFTDETAPLPDETIPSNETAFNETNATNENLSNPFEITYQPSEAHAEPETNGVSNSSVEAEPEIRKNSDSSVFPAEPEIQENSDPPPSAEAVFPTSAEVENPVFEAEPQIRKNSDSSVFPAEPEIPLPINTSIDTFSSQNISVFEINQSAIASLADLGAEEVYLDLPMSALLVDTIPLIQADRAQSELGYTGQGITVCLLDTGVDFTNPSLSGVSISGYDFVNGDTDATDDSYNHHGTFMASIIHAVAPNATIFAVKVLDSTGSGYSSNVIAGIDYCRQLAAGGTIKVISMSLGGGSYDGYCDNANPVAAEASLAAADGLLVVAASGNDGSSNISAPACAKNATAVGSTSKSDALYPRSNINPSLVGLLAPGESVSAPPYSGSGTSISTAHVSGVAALLLQSNPSLTPSEADYRLLTTGRLLEFNGSNYSRVDAYNALTNNFTGFPTKLSFAANNQQGNVIYGVQTAAGNATCGDALNETGATYTMNASSSINGSTCFTISAANVTIDCNGYSITGNNSSSTYGIYSNQFNTTIRNCAISGFDFTIYTYRGLNTTALGVSAGNGNGCINIQ